MSISYTIEPKHIEWEMDWSDKDDKGNRRYPDKPEKEMMFEPEQALALMLANDIIFINSHWWENEWPEKARKATGLFVNCNDVFAWGCADGQEISSEELEALYRLWMENNTWGPSLWCMIKRRQMPQDPIVDAMRDAGINLDEFKEKHNLRVNFYSGLCGEIAKFKYESYSAWANENGHEVMPFDKHWWNGWNQFIAANPNWKNEIGEPEEKRIRQEFIERRGY